MRTLKRLTKAGLGVALVLVALLIAGLALAFHSLRASLPDYDLAARVPGLAAPVTITRDALAVPSIRAATDHDATRALAFVHTQDRFFQMDLARRVGAGRLSELLGPATLEYDKRLRALRLTDVAERRYRAMPSDHRELLEAYAGGVNAALARLPVPPEFAVLGLSPEAWRPQDCVLVELNMHLGLSRFGDVEQDIALMRATLPDALTDFLTPRATRFDAPLLESTPPPIPPPIPGPDVVDLRTSAAPITVGGRRERRGGSGGGGVGVGRELLVPGSNSFAVAGARTADGRAILENDMHLGVNAPNIWYRADLIWGPTGPDATPPQRAVGVTLPGAPGLVVGSNTHVAWGFTNITGDFVDHVVVESPEGDSDRYLTPDGPVPFDWITETIEIRGRAPVRHEMRSTRWGVVTGADHLGRPLVLQWTALEPERCNLAILDMVHARSLDEAVEIARRWRGPPQNVLIASDDGRIAWVPAGDVPIRVGFDGTVPTPRIEHGVGWDGSLPDRARPVIIDPANDALWTANARTLPLPTADTFGHNWAHGYRARRIRNLLLEREDHTERSLLAIALDTRVEPYDFYRDLVLATIPDDEPDPGLARARAAIASWSGHAVADDTGIALLGEFRARLSRLVIGPLLAPARTRDEAFFPRWLNLDEPLRRILETRPPHLLAPDHADWTDPIRAALADAAASLERDHPSTAPATPWRDVNRTRTRHAVTRALPFLIPILDLPARPLDGHPWCPRVAAPTFGASERLVVSPGHEADAILHMPTGQSGHPLSRHYRDMQGAWRRGEPTPLLPGPPVHTTTLTP